jgi:hypothetical protein
VQRHRPGEGSGDAAGGGATLVVTEGGPG